MVDSDGVVYQGIGLRSPKGYVPVIPKYRVDYGIRCGESIWRRGRICLQRIIESYGPKGLEDALRSSSTRLYYDPYYGAWMPYLNQDKVILYISPRDALMSAIKNPLSNALIDVIEVITGLRAHGLVMEDLGLTGSLALGFASDKHSDIDLVVYGEVGAVRMMDLFEKIGRASSAAGRGTIGGITLDPPLDTTWRRAILPWGSRIVSWTGVPEKVLLHCDRLGVKDYRAVNKVDALINVPPGQASALLYPPCVMADDGRVLVSYEYNLGAILYKGGAMVVRGFQNSNGDTIFIGLREYPGSIVYVRQSQDTPSGAFIKQ